MKKSKAVNPYGDGLACGRIVNALLYRNIKRCEIKPENQTINIF